MQVQLGDTDEKQFVLLSLLDTYPFVSPSHDTSTVGPRTLVKSVRLTARFASLTAVVKVSAVPSAREQ